MIVSYRTKRFFRGLAATALTLVLIAVVVWLVWLLWLDRYVVYTRDGAKLDFSLSDKVASGALAVPPQESPTVSIYYNEGDSAINISTELTQVIGYYIDTDMLSNTETIAEVMSQLKKLPPQTPVLVEVKDIVGRFFYNTSLGPTRSSIDLAAVEQLFSYLRMSDLYTIAKFPALRDYYYGLDHVPDGIPVKGGYLWMDDDRCYWLNPGSSGTLSYVIQIVTELKQAGFHEVVLGDFQIPTANTIVFKENRTETLVAAANKIIEACSSDRFTISFSTADPAFPLPEGRTRLYLENQAAADVKNLASQVLFEDTAVRLVFMTNVNDTRFNDYGVLRPITSAQLEE